MNASEPPRPFLSIRNLTKAFGSFVALENISLDVAEGEFACFLGPSGCGKTTLLRAIAGLDIQTAGSIEQAGEDISALPPSRRDFGIVFQSYALFPNLSIERNVAYGLENAGLDRAQIRERVQELLALVDLTDQAPKYPAQLSGGQQQRVALARALATSPGLLLLDEPLSALDAKVRVHLRHEIKSLQERLGVTTIMVTHDQEEALSMADRIVVMNDGRIEQVGTPTDIYRHPASVFVADFIGEMNTFRGVASSPSRIDVGSATLRCDHASLATGSDVVLIIRPEDLELSKSNSPDATNALPATVSDLEFLGAYWRVHLECPDLSAQPVSANLSVTTMREMAITAGMALTVVLPHERLQVFSREGT